MRTSRDQPKTAKKTEGGPNKNNCWQYANVMRCRFTNFLRPFFCWLAKSFENPDNFPDFLISVFTLVLAIFAYYAWDESTRGTAALEGQLKAMQAEQRPYIWVTDDPMAIQLNIVPGSNNGQIRVNFRYTNFGRGVAYNIRRNLFIKVDSGRYEPSYGEDNSRSAIAGGGYIIPPGKVDFMTAKSKPGITELDGSRMIKTDNAIGVLVEFTYSDIYGTEFSDVICFESLASGAIEYIDPKSCKH